MERQKCCKLCSRTFPNGRALGGHMKAHLATFPLPPKPPQPPAPPLPSSESSSSFSSFSESEPEDKTALIYGLRENPKKSFRVADPEFSPLAAPLLPPPDSVAVQDRESETESSKKPTRQRSKRTWKRTWRARSILHNHEDDKEQLKKKQPKLGFMEHEHEYEAEPVSSVSETSVVEDVAMFLVMLSRDTWSNKDAILVKQEGEVERSKAGSGNGIKMKKVRVRGKHSHQCENCGKTFRSSRALGSHRSICCDGGGSGASDRIFQCPFCFKIFGSGQALGGHKRSHLIAMAAPSSSSSTAKNFIDLNLPAPLEEQHEDDLGVVSDVSYT
ncbi:zinc finger protein ZAT1-like [Arachis stenosperma]|uniref:zinc finger protein ZAT1-like n=1 Tax=Arachis stenosperma TaxID=217475 RepID=UPI0025AC98AA|nr:zinc finger protein ZAT1-like [Arachis stenosperma]